MKRKLQKMIVLLAILFVPFFLFSQEYASILNESFENGIPEGWTQECVSGNVKWVKETGGSFPTGAFDGNARLRFSADTNVTTYAVTRLITPNLSNSEDGKVSFARLADPILVFAHAQDKWTNDFDVLRVLYKTKADGAWGKLIEYDNYISKWSLDTLSLAALSGSAFLQLAFEAEDKLGQGIVLDKVEIRSAPNCFAPDEMVVGDLSSDTARISWIGSWDVKSFTLKVSTSPISPEQLEDESYKANIADTVLMRTNTYVVKGLQPNVKYYYYMRSDCYGEYSEWALDSFTTVNYMDISREEPYVTDFDLNATPGLPSRMSIWYYGAAEDAYPPYINTGRSSSLGSYSVNNDYALCFYAGHYYTTMYNGSSNIPYIPENSYAYAVMPKLRDSVNVKDLYLSLWTYNYNAEHFDIIVGLTEDPTDINSFEPVDTLITKYAQNKEERVVSFENYEGDGKYIAFMSRFPYRNCFTFDSLTVAYRSTFVKITEYEMTLPTATSVKFDIDAPYSTYEVVLSKTQLADDDAISAATDVIRKRISNHSIIDGLEVATDYYVYVRACNDIKAGEWSDFKYIHTLDKITTLPYVVAEGHDEGNQNSSKYTSSIKYGNKVMGSYCPKEALAFFNYFYATSSSPITISNSHSATAPSKYVYEIRVGNQNISGSYAAMVFPELYVGFDTTRVSFYIANPSDNYKVSSAVVGFLSVANDIKTFQPIDTITLNDGAGKFVYYDLDKYADVKGKFFAVYSAGDDVLGKSTHNYFYIDDVKFTKIPECATPTNIQIVATPEDPSEVTFSWDANGVDKWVFRLFAEKHSTDDMSSEVADTIEYIQNDTLTTNSIVVKGLEYPHQKYYYSILGICGTKSGDWTFVDEYITECKGYEKLPYSEDFENYVASTQGQIKDFPACLYTQQYAYLNPNYRPGVASSIEYYHYPFIEQSVSGKDGNKSKMLYMINKTSPRSGDKERYVALPKMEKSIKELQVSFDVYSSRDDYSVLVGAMTDPTDSTTFEVIKSVSMSSEPTSKWCRHIVVLDTYTGEGENIAFKISTKYTSWSAYYIDNIYVEEIQTCARPENVEASDISFNYVSLKWESPKDNNMWEVVIAKQQLTDVQLNSPKVDGSVIFRIDTVTANPCTLNNLESNTGYFVYVRALCGDDAGIWSRVLSIRTNCQPLSLENVIIEENFESFENGVAPDCYLVGNNTSMTNATYIPSCSRDYAHSGFTSLKFRTEVGTSIYNGAYVVSPRLDVEDIKNVRLRFWGAAPSRSLASDKNAHSIIVGVVTNPANYGTFEAIDTLNFGLEWRPYEVTFEKYEGDYLDNKGQYIMLLSNFSKSNTVYIDDISYDLIPECYTGVNVTNVTDKSIDLSLTGTAPYQVKYSKNFLLEEELDAANTIDLADGNTLTINNLKPNLDYYVYVRSTCTDNSWSEWSTVKIVRTSCSNKIALPYSEGFEQNYATSSTDVGLMPQCWNGYYKPNNDYPSVVTYAKTGSSSVVLNAEKEDEEAYLVSEEIDIDSLNTCMVTLYARAYTSSSTYNQSPYLIMGVVEDIEDIPGSFVPVDTIMAAGSSFTKKELYFTNYAGPGKRVAFRSDFALNEKKARVYIDDILIEEIPTCPRPYNFAFVSYSDTSFTYSFSHDSGVKYEFKCGPVGFDPMEDAGVVTEFTGETASAMGLAPATEYDIYLRAFCNDTDASPWTYVDTRTTLKGFIKEMPYYCNFEGTEVNSKWDFAQENQTDKWYIGVDAAFEVSETKSSTDSALYISYDNGLSMQYFNNGKDKTMMPESYSWAYVTVYLAKGVYDVSYTWTCTGMSHPKDPSMALDFMKAMLIPVTSTFSGGRNQVTSLKGMTTYLSDPMNISGSQGMFELSPGRKMAFLANNDGWTTENVEVTITENDEGIYHLVFYWNNQMPDGDPTIRSGAIDDISIVPQTCMAPLDFEMTRFDNKSADFTWNSLESDSEFIIKVTDNTELAVEDLTEDDIVFVDTVQTTFATVTGLKQMTEYRAYVSTYCGEEIPSVWIDPIKFETPCDPFQTDVVYSFDNDTAFSSCYVVSHIQPTSDVYRHVRPKLIENGDVIYDRTGDETSKAIKFNQKGVAVPGSDLPFNPASYNNWAGGYLALPLFEGDLDSLYLNFWMRCVTHNAQSGLVNIETLNDDPKQGFARKITVGTMTDPDVPNTFKALKVFEYPYSTKDIPLGTKVSDDLTGCNFWVKCSVPLKDAQGLFIAFKNDKYGFYENVVYIDDIEITSRKCAAPINIEVNNVRMNSAELTIVDNADEYIVQIADNEDFDNAIVDTVSTFPYKFENLKGLTNYYVRVKTVCGPFEESDWSIPVVFETLRGVVYRENFAQQTFCPQDWTRASETLLASVLGSSSPRFKYLQPSSGSGWITKEALTESGMFSTNHMVVTFGGTNSWWLFSPAIDLADTTAKYHMSFELALTNYASSEPIPSQAQDDIANKFVVLISEDGGNTWQKGNATTWNWKASGEYSCLNIPNTGKQYSLDLSKYAGKAIMVAFHIETDKAIGKSDLHLDNVHINAYQEAPEAATICETLDYNGTYFSFLSDELEVGENNFIKWSLAEGKVKYDTCYTLNVNVTPMAITQLEPAYMCENGVYNDVENNFIGLTKPGTYKRKLKAYNDCDSIVVLELNAHPIVEVQVFDTICQGMTLDWNGHKLYMTGVTKDTLTSVVTGCDSIVTLVLKVNDAIRHTEYAYICHGESYNFFGETITESGSYEKLIKTPGGCDSLITLIANVLPDYSNIVINAAIAEGETYTENGFVGLTQPGSYRLPLKSKVGDCDSIVTLNLVVGNANYSEKVNLCFGDTLQFGSQTITQTGQYIEEFTTDSVVLLNVTVLPDLRQTLDVLICKGERYELGGKFFTETGTYTEEYRSVDGCDSTITLNLRVLNGETIYVTDTITIAELPYEYMDLYYDLATAPGTYKETIELEAENCKDIIQHTLVVVLADAIDNIEQTELTLVPNPVNVNSTLYVEADFTANERKDMLVEVFNAVGQRVYVETPVVYPIAIDGLTERGVYVVRIITGEGTVYQGKVVVK